jgi:hypothetical protein
MKAKHLRNLLLLGITALWLSLPAGAQVHVQVGIQLPPPIVFSAPPEVVVMPGSYVYVAPDVEEDIYFVDGFWWRPWNGHWYRSQYYDRGWGYYESEPVFYREVHDDWRTEYHHHTWGGQPWHPERMHHDYVQKNWNNWQREKHWERSNSWGVKGYRPRPQPVHHQNVQRPEHGGQPRGRDNFQRPDHSRQPEARGNMQRPEHGRQPEARGNMQRPEHGRQPEARDNNRQPQGHGRENNRPEGHAQAPQGHQVEHQQPHNQPAQHGGRGSKDDKKDHDRH